MTVVTDPAAGEAAAIAARRQRAGGAAVLLLTRVAGMAIGLVVMVLAAKSLGPNGFGTFTFSLALVQIGMTLADFGLGSLLIREAAGEPRQLRSLLAWGIGARFAGGTVVGLGLAAFAVTTVPAGEQRTATLLVIATLPISAFWLGHSALQHFGLLRRLSVLLFAQTLAWFAAVALLVAQGAGLRTFALVYLLYSIGYAATVQITISRTLSGMDTQRVSAKVFGRLLRAALPLAATVIIIALYYRLDSIFVYRISGPAAAGAYGVAYRFLDQAQALPITLCAVFLPLLSAERAAGRPIGAVFTTYLRISLLTSVPAVALAILVADRFVVGIFGRQYEESVILLQVLLLSFVPITVGYILGQVAIVHHQYRKQLLTALLALAMNVALNSVFIPIYGPRAAATITVLTEIVVVSSLYLTLRTPCGLALPGGWLARLGAATLAAVLVGLALQRYVWAAGIAFVVCFLAVGAALRLVDRTEITSLIPARYR